MIFVDTGPWFESAIGSEVGFHAQRLIDERSGALATIDAVVTELWNLLYTRGYRHLATETCLDILASSEVLDTGARDRARAADILRAWADQTFSYVDALSFTVMEREGIDSVFTFDRHFRIYRHGPGRRRGFTVLPD